MIIGIAAARFGDNAIGFDGNIPWNLPEDLKYFRDITTRGSGPNVCLMGRKTYESLPVKKLPERILHVISGKEVAGNVGRSGSVDEAVTDIMRDMGNVNIYICGGERVYKESLELVDEFHLTRVFSQPGPADAFFPMDAFKKIFKLHSQSEVMESKTGLRFCIEVYRRESMDPSYEEQYRKIATELIMNGVRREDRTGVGTRSLFGKSMSFDLRNGFPILTSKRVFWRGVVEELMWFVRGRTDSKELEERGVKIWTGNTSRDFLDRRGLDYRVGDIGPGYGFQWRHWGAEYQGCDHPYESLGIDQLRNLVKSIKENPHDRRHIVSAWNVSDLERCALPPCHILFQVYVDGDFLDMNMYQRSADWFLGVPFNMASYALLLSMIASVTNKTPRRLTMMFGDMHIYENHLESVLEQLCSQTHPPPRLGIRAGEREFVDEFTPEDFTLEDYKYSKVLSAPMAV